MQRFGNHVLRQIVGQIGQIVGFQVFHRRQQLFAVHRFDQRFAHRVGHFQQHFAVFFGRGQTPHQHALIGRQLFEHVGDVGRMQLVQDAGERLQTAVGLRVGKGVVGRDQRVVRQQQLGQIVDAFDVDGGALFGGTAIVGGLRFHKCSACLCGGHSGRFRVCVGKNGSVTNWEGP